MEWIDPWAGNWPDWQDCGKDLEAVLEDGQVVSGCLRADVGFDGEDEYPAFEIELSDGTSVPFVHAVKIRWPPTASGIEAEGRDA